MVGMAAVIVGHPHHFGFGRVGGRLVDKRPAYCER